MISVFLLLPVATIVLAGKAIEILPGLIGRISKILMVLSIWLAAAYITAHAFAGDPANVEKFKGEMASLGRWIITVSGN